MDIDISVLVAVEGYQTIDAQIKVLIQQRDQLVSVVCDDIKRRLSTFSTMNVPSELTFIGVTPPPQRGEWNQARWNLTDMVLNLFEAWAIVANSEQHRSLELEGELLHLHAAPSGSAPRHAVIPTWMMSQEPAEIASFVMSCIQAAEAEKYPSS